MRSAFETKSAAISAFSFALENGAMSRGNITVLMITEKIMIWVAMMNFIPKTPILTKKINTSQKGTGWLGSPFYEIKKALILRTMASLTCMCCDNKDCRYSWLWLRGLSSEFAQDYSPPVTHYNSNHHDHHHHHH